MEKNTLKNANFRTRVVDILLQSFYEKALLNDKLWDEGLISDAHSDNSKDIKRVVLGVIENRILLEYIIEKFSKTPLKKLDKTVYTVLLSALYEMLYMDGLPVYATINEYVNIVKKKAYKLSGFVNANLREIDRNMDRVKDLIEKAPYEIKYSIPDSISKYYKKYNINLSADYDIDKARHDYIRLDVFDDAEVKGILNEFDTLDIKYKKYDGSLDFQKFNIYEVSDIKKALSTKALNEGLFYIEDVSSIYAVEKVYEAIENITKNIDKDGNDDRGLSTLSILDACSSPGGKILGLAAVLEKYYLENKKADAKSLSENKLNITASDKTKDKVDKINENIKARKSHIKSDIKVEVRDATEYYDKYKGSFDVIWTDVPCSGLGVIKRKPDIAYNFNKQGLAAIVNLQRKIVDNTKKYLKPNGIFVYSTCTITDSENEANAKYILDNNKDFKLIYEKRFLPYDKDLKSDGFYIAIFERQQ